MELVVDRKWKLKEYTISNLTIDGKWFCNVLEDTDRGLSSDMEESEIKSIKVASQTAIPIGTYEITLDVVSPRFGKSPFYKGVCGGKLPRLIGVKGFDGVLIHAGNTAKDSAGCLLVGVNNVKGQVTNSRNTFTELYRLLKEANDRKEKLTVKIL